MRFLQLFIGISVFILDFFSKFWIAHNLSSLEYSYRYPYGGIAVFKNFFGIEFSIIHATNRGAAWGILADYQIYLLFFRIFLILGLLTYVIFFNKRSNWGIPLALITAGACGNVLDYFLYGHVVDMFHFIFWGYDYPVFNIADSAIFIGIFWLLIISWNDKSLTNKTT